MSPDPSSPLAALLSIDPAALDVAAVLFTSVAITAIVLIVAYLAFADLRDRMRDHRDGGWDLAAFDAETDRALTGWENHLDARRDGWRDIKPKR